MSDCRIQLLDYALAADGRAVLLDGRGQQLPLDTEPVYLAFDRDKPSEWCNSMGCVMYPVSQRETP